MAKRQAQNGGALQDFVPEVVSLDDLRPHPRNMVTHPDDQIEHLAQSIRENGVYRNVVTARDLTILAGHGVTQAARRAGRKTIPVIRLDLGPDDPQALKILAGDNEVQHLRIVDDHRLSEMLREIKATTKTGLLGTGYDERMLANLVYVTRPAQEIKDHAEAAHWVGMPDYDPGGQTLKLVISFTDAADREELVERIGLRIDKKESIAWTTRYPFTEREDLSAVRFAP